MTFKRSRPRARCAAAGLHRSRLHPPRRRLGAGRLRRHQGAVHRLGRGEGAAAQARQRRGLADGRVRHAAALDAHAQRPRGGARQAERPHAGDPAPDRPVAALRVRPRARSASARSRSTATCCRPTAARAPRRSPAPSSPRTTRWRGCSPQGKLARSPIRDFVAAVSVGIVEGTPLLDLEYVEDVGLRHRHERRHDRRPAASSRCRARPRARPSRAPRWTRCSRSPARASRELVAAQRARAGGAADGRGVRLVLASNNPGKLAELRRAVRAARRRAGRAGRARHRRGRRAARHLHRERARQGAPRRARRRRRGDRRRLGPVRRRARRRARRRVGALRDGRAPARRRPRGVPARRTPPTTARLLEQLRGVADRRAALRQHAGRACAAPTIPSRWSRSAAGRARSLDAPRGDGRLRLRPADVHPGVRPTVAELDAGDQERAQPPRAGRARDARADARRPGALARRARPLRPRSRDGRVPIDAAPTAPPSDVAERLARCMRPARCTLAALPPLSLYVHLPWCLKKCPYCDFNSHDWRGGAATLPEARYLDALVRRPGAVAAVRLGPARAQRLHRRRHAEPVLAGGDRAAARRRSARACRSSPAARSRSRPTPAPSSASASAPIAQAGVTRLSIGVQSFDDAKLHALGRVHDARAGARRGRRGARAPSTPSTST